MIFHLALERDWAGAGETYRVSTRGRTLEEVGFIHCSATRAQLDAVARAYYADCREPLVVLVIDPAGLDVRVEGGFPHLYGPLPRTHVTTVVPYAARFAG
ncbi:DUF952 domain-containing protein [Thermoactinospora rubra]|uniref:DUF952 domain-containing protein n=1 Tax=Thermoactinospora rubra TaxID=1088767 RepID=UPI000A100AE0|nr:DUF952 domain-containing protein [Thermoactinospora rubra]